MGGSKNLKTLKILNGPLRSSILPADKRKEDDRGWTCHMALWVGLYCV